MIIQKVTNKTPEAFRERMAARGMDNLMMNKQQHNTKGESIEETKDYEINEEIIDSQEFQDLQNLLKATEEKLESANKEIENLKLTIDEREEIMEELREQLNSDTQAADDVQKENIEQTETIKRLEEELDKAQSQLTALQTQLKSNKGDYEKLVKDIPEVKELEAIRKAMGNNERQRELDGQRDKALRFRSGLLFQRALDKLKIDEKEPEKSHKKSKIKDAVKTGDYYLTDDRALIRFLNIVERNDKSLYQRLLDADVEKTGTLRKSQFTNMLNDLKITPQDVMSLQRIAGFSTGLKHIQIDEFIKIIKERGKIRQKVEDETFRKVQKAIRKEGWSIKETFEIFDIDNNNKLDYQEMVDGFKKLKIHVPNKHLKSIFAILDEDGNGSVSLKEFKKKLDAYDKKPKNDDTYEQEGEENEEEEYQKKEDQKKLQFEEDKKKSLLTEKDIKEYKKNIIKDKNSERENNNQKQEKNKKLDEKDVVKKRQVEEIKEKVKEETKKEYEEQLINGQLKVQVGKGYKLPNLKPEGYKYFYLVFFLEGANNNESFTSKPISYYSRNTFNWSVVIPMVQCHPDEFNSEFNLKLFASKGEFENSDFIGEIFCKWKATIDKPNTYAVANKYELSDAGNICTITKVTGRILVSAKFITAGEKESDFTKEGQGKSSLKDAKSKSTKKVEKGPLSKMGDLQIEIFRGKGFEGNLRHKICIKLESSKNRENTQTVRASARPDFDEKIIIPVYKRETQDVPNLIIQDIDPDEEDILSKFELNFSKIAYTDTQSQIATKWYAFESNSEKVIQLQLTFTNVHYELPKYNKVEPKVVIDEDKAPTPKMTEFKFDDAAIPDPKDTDKFADEFPSENSEEKILNEKASEEVEKGEEDNFSPMKAVQINIGDAAAEFSDGSGDFNNL